jgi:hypothetical protein
LSSQLFIVLGGELTDPSTVEFRDPKTIHFVGAFTNKQDAKNAWKAEAWRTVDNALMRYFIYPTIPV